MNTIEVPMQEIRTSPKTRFESDTLVHLASGCSIEVLIEVSSRDALIAEWKDWGPSEKAGSALAEVTSVLPNPLFRATLDAVMLAKVLRLSSVLKVEENRPVAAH